MSSKIVSFLAACALACAAFGEMSIEAQKKWEAMKNRTMLLSRQVITDPAGYKFIVEHWQNPNDGLGEWRTNAMVKVTGRKQTTSWGRVKAELEDKLSRETVKADRARKVEKAVSKAVEKDRKNLEKWIKETEKARDKSSDGMKDFYDSILGLVTEVN